MRGSAALRASVAPGGLLAGPWVRNELWRRALAVPSLDLRFAESKSLVDSISGQNLINFTRASSATFVDSQGVIQRATTNLLLRSEEFDNASWIRGSNIQVSANAVIAPNGTPTAERLSSDGTQIGFIEQSVSVISGLTYTVSCYLKKHNTSTAIILLYGAQFNSGGSNIVATFNFDTGVATVTGGGTASMAPVGDGWYRCRLTKDATTTSTNNQQIVRLVGNLGDVYAWGAQLEQSSTVGEYVPTGATINSTPRFTHDPVTLESLGLLVEEQRTNSIRNNTMAGAVAGTPGTLPTNWTDVGLLSGLSRQVVEIGTLNGVSYIDLRFYGTTNSTFFAIALEGNSNISAATGQQWSESAWISIVNGTTNNISSLGFNIVERTSGGGLVFQQTGGNLLGLVNNSLLRYSSTFTLSGGATTAFAVPRIIFGCSTGSVIDITLRIGLPQLEQGTFATSVIPTSGTSVTRSADVASITESAFSLWYKQDEGTVFAECAITQPNSGGNQFVFRASDNGYNNSIAWNVQSSGFASIATAANGVFDGVASSISSLNANTLSKFAAGYQANNLAISLSGATPVVDTTATMPTALNRADIGSDHAGFNRVRSGTIRRLSYWPRRLDNTTLQALTQ